LFLAFSKNVDESLFHDKDNQAVRVSLALRNVIHSTNICTGVVDSFKEAPWRQSFMEAVCEVLMGFKEERPCLEAKKIAMYDWMRVRAITISGCASSMLSSRPNTLTFTSSSLPDPGPC